MTLERRGCVNPGEISAEDRLAFGRGEAPPKVAGHIERCPACRADAAAHVTLDGLLHRELFRRSCPPSLTIGEFAAGLLQPAESQPLARHMLECTYCRAERASFTSFLATADEPQAESGLLRSIRRLLAQPLTSTAPAFAGLRGGSDEETVTYSAEGILLTVSVQRAGPSANGGVVVGLLEPGPESYEGASAQLYAGETLLQTQAVDDLGNFLFSDVRSGSYRVEVTVPTALVVIDPLRVP